MNDTPVASSNEYHPSLKSEHLTTGQESHSISGTRSVKKNFNMPEGTTSSEHIQGIGNLETS